MKMGAIKILTLQKMVQRNGLYLSLTGKVIAVRSRYFVKRNALDGAHPIRSGQKGPFRHTVQTIGLALCINELQNLRFGRTSPSSNI